ncbi:iron-containing alcohol dehydrogenase [bacterium]|nr:iron-containing alcohol dehydrogenase [bacterium]
MQPFEVYIPTRIKFGPGRILEVGKIASDLGKKALIVIGGGSVKRIGALDKVQASLTSAGIESTVFEGIEPNPRHTTVNKAGKLAYAEGVDLIVALGGGSVMDASKFVAVLAKQPETDSWSLTSRQPNEGKVGDPLPIIAIPTTAATASEVTPFAVLSNEDIKGKAPMAHEKVKPMVAILDPELHTSLPEKTTVDGAADIMSHVFENYIAGGNDSILADRYTESVLKTVLEATPAAIDDPGDLNARGDLQWAATLALNGMQGVGRAPSGFPMHNMEHALSGQVPDLAHGRGLAVLYPSYFRWMIGHGRAVDRFARLGREMFDVGATDDRIAAAEFIDCFSRWLESVGLYESLVDAGVPEDAFEPAARYAAEAYGDGESISAAGPVTVDDMVEIFRGTRRQSPAAV